MKKTMWVILAVVVALLILPAVVVFAAPVGKITALEGRVDMTPAGTKEAVSVTVGTNVNTGDIIRAKSKSKAEVTFTDGNILRLAENSRLRVTQYQPEDGKKNYVNLFRGKTQAVVDKLKKNSSFEVHTPTAICGVRGTVFYSSYINGQSSFVFQSGAGYGYNINRPDQVVAIPAKVFMVVQSADKPPLLRPATDVELDKHQKDTTPAAAPKKEEAKKEEEKKPGEVKAANEEGKPKEEKKEEQAKEEKPKAGDTVAKKDEGEAEEKSKTDTQSKSDNPSGEPQSKTADKNGAKPAEEAPKQVVASTNADRNERSGPVDIVARTDQSQTSNTGNAAEPVTAPATASSSPPASSPTSAPESDMAAMTMTQALMTERTPAPQNTLETVVVVPVQKPEIIVTKDNTPPEISFSSGPVSLTNMNTATFNYNSNERVDYEYKLDTDSNWSIGPASTQNGSTTISNIPEGARTLTIRATDAGGNVSTQSYSWTTDYTAPNVSIDSKPKSITNQNSASFGFSADKTVQNYSYRIDGGTWTDTTDKSVALANLSAASHNFEVKATDKAGNVATVQSYSWTTDYTAPTIDMTPQASVPKANLKADVEINLTSDKNASYEYKVDDGSYTATDASLLVADLSPGTHTVVTRATDEAGNVSAEQSSSFALSRYDVTGSAVVKETSGSQTFTGSNVNGYYAGISNQSWGGWKTHYQGAGGPLPTGGPLALEAGAANETEGYIWLSKATVNVGDMGNVTGSSWDMTYLSSSSLVIGSGSNGALSGTNGTNWEIWDDGAGKYTETPLSFWATFRTDKGYYFRSWNKTGEGTMERDGNLKGMIGGTESLLSGSPGFTGLTGYNNPNGRPLWFSELKGEIVDGKTKFLGAAIGTGMGADVSFEGRMVALYSRADDASSTGYTAGHLVSGLITGEDFQSIDMGKLSGSLTATDVGRTVVTPAGIDYGSSDVNVSASSSSPNFSGKFSGDAGNITGRLVEYVFAYLRDQQVEDSNPYWGIAVADLGGTYVSDPANPSSWSARFGRKDANNNGIPRLFGIHDVTGTDWSAGKMAGTVSPRFINTRYSGGVSGINPMTVHLMGTYNSSDKTWQASTIGLGKATPLTFVSLLHDSTWNGQRLLYPRSPDYSAATLVGTYKEPLRFEVSWTGEDIGYQAQAMIPRALPSDRQSYHLYRYRTGNAGYNSYRYPGAYFTSDDKYESIKMSVYQRNNGNTYYYVRDYNANPTSFADVTIKVFKESDADNPVATITAPANEGDVWWNAFRIDTNWDTTESDLAKRDYTASLYRINTTDPDKSAIDTQLVNTGSLSALMGGMESIWTNVSVPIRLMGSLPDAKGFNRYWSQGLVPYNFSKSQYITYDDGTYFGFLDGINRVNYDAMEGRINALYIDPDGKAGILKGSYGHDAANYPGKSYPDIGLWEADGTLARYQMSDGTGITPADLSGTWFSVGQNWDTYSKTSVSATGEYITRAHFSSWNQDEISYVGSGRNLQEREAFGLMTDSYFGNPSYMSNREDYLETVYLKSANDFGIFHWGAAGRYDVTAGSSANWLIGTEFNMEVNPPSDNRIITRLQMFAYGDLWTEERFTGKAVGYGAHGGAGKAMVVAGETLGSYNDSVSYFFALSGGAWLTVDRYLSMLGDAAGKQKLIDLGFRTTEVPLASVDSKAQTLEGDISIRDLKVFPLDFPSAANNVLSLLTAGEVSSTVSSWFDSRFYPITGVSSELPVYGIASRDYRTGETAPFRWRGTARGLGVFQKSDNSAIQASFYLHTAGSSSDGSGYIGKAAGDWMPVEVMSEIPSIPLRAADSTLLVDDGQIKGLLGSGEGKFWTANAIHGVETTSLQAYGIWTGAASMAYNSHIFSTEIFPRNYENEPYTNTTRSGHSFWGILGGIHQYRSDTENHGMDAMMTTMFVDTQGKTGLYGLRANLPDDSSGGYNTSTRSFYLNPHEDMTIVTMGTTSLTNPADITNSVSREKLQTQYDVLSGATFYNANGTDIPNSHITPSGPAKYFDVHWIKADSPAHWGIWYSEGLYGSYSLPVVTDPYTWKMELEATPAEREAGKDMGAIITGQSWKDNRLDGDIHGYWADIASATRGAATGIFVGNILGTFDPNSSTFQSVALGNFLETGKFLDMTADQAGKNALRALNIPCVQVGYLDLKGNNGNLEVNMLGVKFFAHSSGATPSLFATNNVNGSYTTTAPTAGTFVPLSATAGGTIGTSTFTVQSWNSANNGKWSATVQGANANIGSTANLQGLNIKGAAAGNITGTNFSGTAAGVAKQGALPTPE